MPLTNDCADFARWLDIVLVPELPEGIAAFNFNLYEDGEDSRLFAAQLIGAPSYDPLMPDWACEELFTTGEYLFLIRAESWLDCLEICEGFIRDYLRRGRYRDKLLAARAVTAGFVDGDIVAVWEK